jgi:hypothetical protein
MPLGGDDLDSLVRACGLEPEPATTSVIERRTGGNPFFVTELLRAARASGRDGRAREVMAAGLPTRVSDLVAQRVGGLPEAVTEMLVAASIVGIEGDIRTLADIRRSTVESVVGLTEQARAAAILDAAPAGKWRFRHDLLRAGVEASVPDVERARLHALVLEALAADPATPASVLARHAVAAVPFFDDERAIALATRAGEAASAQYGYEEAVAWFGAALAAAPADLAPRWRADLLVQCAEAHRHLGEVGAARQAFAAAASLTDDPGLLARAALGFADPGADLGIAYRTQDPTPCALLDRAIAAQPDADSVTTAVLEARLAAELYFSDEPDRARELSDSACARAARLGDARALVAAGAVHHDSSVVGQADLADQLSGSARLLQWATSDRSVASLLTAHRARVFDLLAAGDLAGCDAEILAFRRVADPLRVPGYQWWPALWSAMRALLEGRHDEAEARAVEAFGIGEGPFETLAMTNLSFLLFFLRREQGRLGELETATRDFATSRADIGSIRVALALLLAETGRTDEAAGMLQAIGRDLERLRDRNWPASWFQLARVAFLCRDRAAAAVLLEARHRPTERCVQVSLGTVCLGAADLAAAWLAHTVGDHDEADVRYRSAEAINAELGARSWLAQARADHARLLADRGREADRHEAGELRRSALAAATDIGMSALVASLSAERDADVDGAEAMSSAATQRPAPSSGVFRREGVAWEIGFAGLTVRQPHSRGLSDLAFLLARPGEAISVLELLSEPGAVAGGARGALVLDERARREIRDRLQELDREADDAEAVGDATRLAAATERRQLLAETVVRDYGLGGRSRRLDDPVERARKTVSTRIRRTIATISAAHPALGRHLDRSIDTGTWCAYRPAETVAWTTS